MGKYNNLKSFDLHNAWKSFLKIGSESIAKLLSCLHMSKSYSTNEGHIYHRLHK